MGSGGKRKRVSRFNPTAGKCPDTYTHAQTRTDTHTLKIIYTNEIRPGDDYSTIIARGGE